MRLISKDGTINVPYELAIIEIAQWSDMENKEHYDINATVNDRTRTMCEYYELDDALAELLKVQVAQSQTDTQAKPSIQSPKL